MNAIIEKLEWRRWVSRIAVGLLLMGVAFPIAVNAEQDRAATRQFEAALLKEDWPGVTNALRSDSLSPVERLVKAHAYLAQNQNNDSVCLFLSVSSSDELQAWKQWTLAFAQNNRDKAIAHYLKGDALARLEEWQAALEAFDTALRSQANHPLVLNAKGVVSAIQGNDATSYFDAAIQAKLDFADAYASWGAMYIQKKSGRQGALDLSSKALDISHDFTLAMITHASAEFVDGKWEKAQEGFAKASEKAGCVKEFTAENAARIVEYMNGKESLQVASLPAEQAGMELSRRVSAFQQNPSLWNANRLASFVRENPDQMKYARQTLRDYGTQNPAWEIRALSRFRNGINWNTERAQLFTNLARGITVGGEKLTWRGDRWADAQGRITQGNLSTFRQLESGLFDSSRVSGVTTKPREAQIDDGDWPVVAYYGLLYGVKSK